MPIFAYLVAVGGVLIALMFVTNATLEKSGPPIVTTQRVGLPRPSFPIRHKPSPLRPRLRPTWRRRSCSLPNRRSSRTFRRSYSRRIPRGLRRHPSTSQSSGREISV